MCGCRKAYLSYPALYTHVKNKHDGVFPIGSYAKRKIPKLYEEETDNVFVPNVDKFYSEFQEFVGQVSCAEGKNRPPMTKELIDKIIPSNLPSIENEINGLKAGLKVLGSFEADPEKFQSVKHNMSIYQIMAFYLQTIYKYCSEGFFREYFLLVGMILKSLNDKGEMFSEKEEKKKQSMRNDDTNQKQFCDGVNIQVASEILNLFIAEMFPNLLKSFKNSNVHFEFLGFEDEHIKNLIVMTKFMANWLFNQEFTDYRLEINVDL